MTGSFGDFAEKATRAGVATERTLDAFRSARRETYLPLENARDAYADRILPIPCGQIAERPIDALAITEAASFDTSDRVLEIGTGTGFLTHVIAQLAGHVLTIDRYHTLLSISRDRHAENRLSNVEHRQLDGALSDGLDGTFDRIICTVAFEEPPRPWLDLLVGGGSAIAPIGPRGGPQTIMRLTKVGARYEREPLGHCWFSPAESGIAALL